MGYRGKVEEQARARELRAQSWTLNAIARELGVAKGSVSLWVRDVDFVPLPRTRGHPAGPKHPMRLKREAEIEQCRSEAKEWAHDLSDRDLEMFVLGLYAGEGSKTAGEVAMANTNPQYLKLFLLWLRARFDIDEDRLRCVLYLHEGLDLDAATEFWSETLHVPVEQFTKPYRAVADSSIRSRKHITGCATARYASTLIHRRVMAMIEAISCRFADPG
jgi:transcriptional regulator with XRE-family HTH domain